MPCWGSCLKFIRPRPHESRQDYTNRKSVASKEQRNKTKTLESGLKKDGVSMSGWSCWFRVDRGSIRVRKYEVSKKIWVRVDATLRAGMLMENLSVVDGYICKLRDVCMYYVNLYLNARNHQML